ncbi:hypothetical protein CBLAS_1410 [Campylobacter blaseri]|uniref:Uncharacterized protein n=1 Tax=Campylobacter blaseri TaxID=2042961 RepID=A0A2P8QYE4_9BACT|nr:hypothetical protein [Campylobacter blaseri]PSM51269.1 hypothetical protein CQ405_09130 [Campylobacter blaseri]PSM52413.1 hypothetical protein CRN67_09135 [Campylobacter blaseri]QKF86574.1 hypothetical protein CBLAS_1410 [Campylobacter blaseri]
MIDKLTQEQLNEWSYLQEQEIYEPLEQKNNRSELEENKEKKKQAQQSFNSSNEHLSKDAKQAIETLEKKEKIDEKIQEKQAELNEFKSPKQKREFLKNKLDNIKNNQNLKESLEILKEKEKLDEQIKAKEKEIKNENLKDNTNEIEKGKENQEEQGKKQNQGNSAEQDDWDKRAKELELQHEKELEALKEQQSKLEANFQKSIDNLMNSDGINGVITALQEMDRSLEMMLKQGKEESETKDKQRKEKLEMAFDSPNFKEVVGDLVKEVYKEQKKVKNGLTTMENEQINYTKLQSTYEKETKKGLDVKGYEKLKTMISNIEKETPNFKENYPKFYKKINDTLKQTKNKILNKSTNVLERN